MTHPQSIGNKNKNKQMGAKLLHNEGNCKQGEKTAFKWEKIIANEATDKESQKYTNSSCHSIPQK